MGICWYCHWGWPKPVADVYAEALAELDGDESPLHDGPAHVVFADENFGDDPVRFSLAECDKPEEYADRFSAADIAIVARALRKMLEIPEEVRCCEPQAYHADSDHPEKYPPPPGVEMVKL